MNCLVLTIYSIKFSMIAPLYNDESTYKRYCYNSIHGINIPVLISFLIIYLGITKGNRNCGQLRITNEELRMGAEYTKD